MLLTYINSTLKHIIKMSIYYTHAITIHFFVSTIIIVEPSSMITTSKLYFLHTTITLLYYAIFSQGHMTPPSRSRSPPLAGGGPSMYARPAMHLYIMHALYFEIYTSPLEGIHLISIAGYEAFVCVCLFVYKTCATLHMATVGRPLSPVCVFILRESFFHTKFYYKKYIPEHERKNFF